MFCEIRPKGPHNGLASQHRSHILGYCNAGGRALLERFFMAVTSCRDGNVSMDIDGISSLFSRTADLDMSYSMGRNKFLRDLGSSLVHYIVIETHHIYWCSIDLGDTHSYGFPGRNFMTCCTLNLQSTHPVRESTILELRRAPDSSASCAPRARVLSL
jgi:hypothetical protein